jgi:hypothetical protein
MVLQRKGSFETQDDPAIASVIRKTRGMTKHSRRRGLKRAA